MSAQNVPYPQRAPGDHTVELKFCEHCGRMFTRKPGSGVKLCAKHMVAFPDPRDLPLGNRERENVLEDNVVRTTRERWVH